jgi:mono/diheme cytochrome c family protein
MRMNTVATNYAVALALLLSASASLAQESRVGKLTGNAEHGKTLYQRYCIFCHGVYGDGTGESAQHLNPKPRDFTLGIFKCRSTPTGSLPLDSDLYDTVTRGVHASGMPSWNPLTRQQRVDLVAYIKGFSPRFQFHEEQRASPLEIPKETPTSAESVKRGAELFESLKCSSCHGKEGRGNGPSASTLTDRKGYLITPFDLTSGTQFKCGQSEREMVRVLMTGLDGSPMPSFLDALKPDQLWDLVHYIRTLQASGKKRALLAGAEPKGE